jgi:hypothetical protein
MPIAEGIIDSAQNNDHVSYFNSALFCHDTSSLSVLDSWLSARYAYGRRA